MTMQRWEPVGEMLTMRNVMERLFDDSYIPSARAWVGLEGEGAIPVDIYHSADEVVVKALMPGFKPEEVDIRITGDTLSIRGEHKEEKEVKEENYLCQELRHGAFSRLITLPVEVNSEKAQAVFENGELTLTLPKVEEAKPKQIKVQTRAVLEEEKKN